MPCDSRFRMERPGVIPWSIYSAANDLHRSCHRPRARFADRSPSPRINLFRSQRTSTWPSGGFVRGILLFLLLIGGRGTLAGQEATEVATIRLLVQSESGPVAGAEVMA